MARGVIASDNYNNYDNDNNNHYNNNRINNNKSNNNNNNNNKDINDNNDGNNNNHDNKTNNGVAPGGGASDYHVTGCVRGEVLMHHLQEEVQRETQMIAGRAVEIKLVSRVERPKAEPIFSVPRRILHRNLLLGGPILEIPEVCTLLRDDHRVVLGHDEHKFFE